MSWPVNCLRVSVSAAQGTSAHSGGLRERGRIMANPWLPANHPFGAAVQLTASPFTSAQVDRATEPRRSAGGGRWGTSGDPARPEGARIRMCNHNRCPPAHVLVTSSQPPPVIGVWMGRSYCQQSSSDAIFGSSHADPARPPLATVRWKALLDWILTIPCTAGPTLLYSSWRSRPKLGAAHIAEHWERT